MLDGTNRDQTGNRETPGETVAPGGALPPANLLKSLEASIGIEPIFTDLQSLKDLSVSNALRPKKYQDKPGTSGEPDTAGFPASNENPGALAGATGAVSNELAFKSEAYRHRLKSATALCHAIADCDPRDACEIMEAALADLRIGLPRAPFGSLMDEARVWAEFSNRSELKAYCAATFDAMTPDDQAAFQAYVQRQVAA